MNIYSAQENIPPLGDVECSGLMTPDSTTPRSAGARMIADSRLRPLLAGPREWAGLAVLALPTLVLALDMSVLYLALPALSVDLGPSETQQLWIIDIYGFIIAGLLITMGALGDRIGRRRLLLIGATAFTAASLAAAFAVSAPMLIIARAALGIAGATLMPSTLALISSMFADARQRTAAISIWIACFMSGMALGPVIGGLILELFWWGAVFLLAVPVMVALLIAGPLLLPEHRSASSAPLDISSAVLSLGAILAVVYGLKRLAAEGSSLAVFVSILVGLLIGVCFVLRQHRLEEPLLDLALLRNRLLVPALLTILVSVAAGGGLYLLATQHLQMVEGLPPLEAGLWLIPTGAASVVGALIAPRLASRFSPGAVISGGLAGAVLGYLLLAAADVGSGFSLVVIGIALVFLGGGPISALGTDLVIASAPPHKAGAAASLSETSTELGISLGVALLGSVAAAVARQQRAASGLTAIPDGTAGEAAQQALVSGLNIAALIAAATIALLAVITAVLFKDRRP